MPAPSQTLQPESPLERISAPEVSSSGQSTVDRRRTEEERPPAPTAEVSSKPHASTDEIVLQSLAVLIREHGARSFTNWYQDDPEDYDSPLQGKSLVGEDTPEQYERCEILADECLKQKRVCFRIMSSAVKTLIVAAPVPAIDGYAITVQFPFNREDDQSKADRRANIHLRCRDVAVTAAHLGIVHLQGQLQDLERVKQTETVAPESWAEATKQYAKFVLEFVKTRLCTPKKLAQIAALGLVCALVPLPHRVSCKVTCEPSLRRYVASPFDAKLLESKVLAGDHVVKNQLLAVLDGSDLRSEIARLEAEMAQASQRRAAAMTSGDASNAELERLEVEKLQREIDVLHSRKANLEIRAPLDGVVVSGNLERRQGAPLEVGDNLFEIAPLKSLVAEIAIPEAEIGRVQEHMQARIVLDAGRGTSQRSSISRIHPRSEMRDSESVFIAEAELVNDRQLIKPGMQGDARISVGWRPIVWILLHRPFEVARGWMGW